MVGCHGYVSVQRLRGTSNGLSQVADFTEVYVKISRGFYFHVENRKNKDDSVCNMTALSLQSDDRPLRTLLIQRRGGGQILTFMHSPDAQVALPKRTSHTLHVLYQQPPNRDADLEWAVR